MLSRLARIAPTVIGAVALAASPASAHSGHTTTLALSTASTSAYPDLTLGFVFGPHEAADVGIEFEEGWNLAPSPSPNDGETIGSVAVTAAWTLTLCATATQNFTLSFEDDMTGAPASAVAHWRMTGTFTSTDLWVVDNGAGGYSLTIPWVSSQTCTSQPSNSAFTMTLDDATASGGRVLQNPSSSGCYSVTVTAVDTASTSHSGSASAAIGTGSC